jgi:CheY-like chemotaxis protein
MEPIQKTLLIIDDDSSLRLNLSVYFKGKGYRVLEADNGKDGLALIASENPNAILLDIVMPEMSGIEVIKEVTKSHPKMIPLITLMTNSADMNFLSEAVDLGVLKYVLKGDISLEDIFHTIDVYAGK